METQQGQPESGQQAIAERPAASAATVSVAQGGQSAILGAGQRQLNLDLPATNDSLSSAQASKYPMSHPTPV